jgi:hypothetical protein
VRDSHTHCPCVGVWLCATCHTWAHHNPTKAKEAGLIVERNVCEPWLMPFKTPTGWVLPDCSGGWTLAL